MAYPKKAYKRLMSLGADKVLAMNSALALGQSTIAVARMIQQEWKLCPDIVEKSLVQQLNRYRIDCIDSVTGSKSVALEDTPRLHKRLDVLCELVELAYVQKDRIILFAKQEREKKVQSPSLRTEIETLQKMLLEVQKTQFDLGIDEFKGPLTQSGRMVASRITTPDGTIVENQVLDAVQRAHSVLDKHGVPAVIEGEFNGDQ